MRTAAILPSSASPRAKQRLSGERRRLDAASARAGDGRRRAARAAQQPLRSSARSSSPASRRSEPPRATQGALAPRGPRRRRPVGGREHRRAPRPRRWHRARLVHPGRLSRAGPLRAGGAPARKPSRGRCWRRRRGRDRARPPRHGHQRPAAQPSRRDPPSFGADSFERHRRLALAAGLRCRVGAALFRRWSIVDTSADLVALRARLAVSRRPAPLRTRAVLGQPERTSDLPLHHHHLRRKAAWRASAPVRSAAFPRYVPGMTWGALIAGALAAARPPREQGGEPMPRDRQVLVIAHKAVSKAEGAIVSLADIHPGARARALARRAGARPTRRPGRARQSAELLRAERGVLISRTRHGFVCANAGVDASNTSAPGHARPAAARPRRLRAADSRRLRELSGLRIGAPPSSSATPSAAPGATASWTSRSASQVCNPWTTGGAAPTRGTRACSDLVGQSPTPPPAPRSSRGKRTLASRSSSSTASSST